MFVSTFEKLHSTWALESSPFNSIPGFLLFPMDSPPAPFCFLPTSLFSMLVASLYCPSSTSRSLTLLSAGHPSCAKQAAESVPLDDHEKWMSGGGGIRQWAKRRKKESMEGGEEAVIGRPMGGGN